MIERLRQFIENQQIPMREFEIKINAADGTIRRAIKKKTDIQAKWIKAISENYPNLSLEWLFRGEEPMLKNDEHININKNNEAFDVKFLKEQNHELMLQIAELNKQIGRLENELQNYRQEYDNKPFSA